MCAGSIEATHVLDIHPLTLRTSSRICDRRRWRRSRGPPGAAPSSYLPVETHRQSTVLRLEQRRQAGGGWREGEWRRGLPLTWWHDSVVEGWVVGTNGPHQAKQAAAKHGRQKGIKCSIEEEDEAWEKGRERWISELATKSDRGSDRTFAADVTEKNKTMEEHVQETISVWNVQLIVH